MKILVTSFTYPPQANGVAEIAKAQATLLAKRGHDVSVATAYDPERKSAHSEGVPVHEFRIEGDFDPKIGYHGEIKEYQQFIAAYPADIILFNCWQNWCVDLALPSFSQIRARKVMVSQGFSAHCWYPQRRFPWGLVQWLRNQPYVWRLPAFMRAFDHLVFLTGMQNFGRFFDYWIARRVGLTHCSVVPNGIHLHELEAAPIDFRKFYEIPSGDLLLLNVANYCDRKNQLMALRAFCALSRNDASLVFIGSEHNEYTDQMLDILNQYPAQASKVKILQKVPKQHINAAYQAADLFLFSSKEETQPLAVLDAMGAGVPFVATDAGCVSEFPGGVIVRSEAQMSRALTTLLSDPTRRAELGEQGRGAARGRYSWEHVVDEYERIFQRLLASPRVLANATAP